MQNTTHIGHKLFIFVLTLLLLVSIIPAVNAENKNADIQFKMTFSHNKLHIFHIEEDGSVEEINEFTVVGNTVIFTASDFSPYLFANKKIENQQKPKESLKYSNSKGDVKEKTKPKTVIKTGMNPISPKTDDNSMVNVWLVLFILACIAAATFIYMKQSIRKKNLVRHK